MRYQGRVVQSAWRDRLRGDPLDPVDQAERCDEASPSPMSVVLAEQDNAGVRLLTLNRPDKRNALNVALLEALAEDLRRSEQDPTVRCIILAGDALAFSAGADIHEMRERGIAVF